MAKYNITEIKEKEATYRSLVSPQMMDELESKINNIIIIQKKYRDKNYSAKKLAEDLGTNTRYISAVVNVRFHMNYTSFVNSHRIREAMTLLVDKRYRALTMEEISDPSQDDGGAQEARAQAGLEEQAQDGRTSIRDS